MKTSTALRAVADAGDETSREPGRLQSGVDIRYLVRALVKYGASDLHLKSGRPPLFRINGKMIPAKMPELEPEHVEQIVMPILSDRQKVTLNEYKQLDLSFIAKGLGRFRGHVYYQKSTLAAAIRVIPLSVPTLDELGIPPIMKELAQRPRGLILITGSTGSGKSTTLASLIHHINETSNVHIICIEDPIEFLHSDIKATVTQREVGTDTRSLKEALYAGLRQDPDVMVIGELRDYEMIQLALTAAESGHLVLSTLHTNDARSTIDRVLEVFPPESKNQARIQLSATLIGVLTQQLLTRSDGSGRIPACEVMVKSPVIENYILKNEVDRIPEAISNSNSYYKMQSMNQALGRLVREGKITLDQAMKSSSSNSDLKLQLQGFVREQGYEVAGQFGNETGSVLTPLEEPSAELEQEEDKPPRSG